MSKKKILILIDDPSSMRVLSSTTSYYHVKAKCKDNHQGPGQRLTSLV